MPCLLLRGAGLVKTVRFKDPNYVGDPRNAVKIFNEKEVDELILLDINATPEGKEPQLELIREIVSEAFMPVAYGGGITSVEQARTILALGVEKIVVNSFAIEHPDFVTEAAALFGSQSVVVCIDAKKDLWGKYDVWTHGGRNKTRLDPVECAVMMEKKGAGEIVLNSIDRDGTRTGYDLALIRAVSSVVHVPVIACGGAGRVEDLALAVKEGGATAVAAGSLFVYQGKHRAVLINYPAPAKLKELLA
jgi:imidazole glycerol-phosphate synthase subunit HisF